MPPVANVDDRKSLRQRAYDEIRQQIIDLRLAPGSRLVERDLATELEVSRIPLREAFQRLQQDGLVVIVPRQGAIVAPFTVDDVRDLFDVRESLEVLAARLAAERADAVGLGKLSVQLDAARAATEGQDRPGIAAANAGFHRIIVELSANPLLESVLRPLESRTRVVVSPDQRPRSRTTMSGARGDPCCHRGARSRQSGRIGVSPRSLRPRRERLADGCRMVGRIHRPRRGHQRPVGGPGLRTTHRTLSVSLILARAARVAHASHYPSI